MNAVVFDTLKLAQRLEHAGFAREQATGAAEALADSFSTEIATRSDLGELRSATRRDLGELRSATRSDLGELRSAMKSDLAELRSTLEGRIATVESGLSKLGAELHREIASVRGEVASVRSSTAQWIIGAVFVNMLGMLGVVAAVWQLAHK